MKLFKHVLFLNVIICSLVVLANDTFPEHRIYNSHTESCRDGYHDSIIYRDGNWKLIQPGLYNMIFDYLKDNPILECGDTSHIPEYYAESCNNLLPYIFIVYLNDNELNKSDSLRYNWRSDTIISLNSYYKNKYWSYYSNQKSTMIWSTCDSIYLHNLMRNKIIHENLNRGTVEDSIFFDCMKNSDLNKMSQLKKYLIPLTDIHKTLPDSIAEVINYRCRIYIKNGKITDIKVNEGFWGVKGQRW